MSNVTRLRTAKRRGLSTLEMILALPILLFVMALMVNFGTAACWKVRTLTMARHALWGTRWPRTGMSDPRPKYWPVAGGVRTAGPSDVPELDDPRVNLPVARGSLEPGATVNAELLDPTRGLREGSADITRKFPMLARMGASELHADTQLLDDKWQYQRMGLPSNRHRRIPVIYALAKAPAGRVGAYVQAVVALLRAPFRPQLGPLDRDDEFIYYRTLFGWGTGAPDFHPGLHRFCSLELAAAEAAVERVIDRIQGKVVKDGDGNVIQKIPSVAEVMARAFINLYESVIGQYEAMLNMVPVPPPGAAAMRAEIAQLQAKIALLDQFLASLETAHGN